jgi:uncharacterized phage-like protein YoqJ
MTESAIKEALEHEIGAAISDGFYTFISGMARGVDLWAANLVRYICSGYSRNCFQIRNEWMVNHSARVIAVYSGEAGGTRNTIEYARQLNVPVNIITL